MALLKNVCLNALVLGRHPTYGYTHVCRFLQKKKVFQIDFEKKKCKTNKDVTNKMFSAFLHSMPKLDLTIFLQNALISKNFENFTHPVFNN